MTPATLLIIFNIFILEAMLSIDNAAALALMVKDLPSKEQSKALKYGIAGAFIFRGVCLFCASVLIKIQWLKIVGGIYLFYLVYTHCTPEKDSVEEGIDKQHNAFFLKVKNILGSFWSTVLLVEIMDIAFSVDNIFAAVAITDRFWLIVIGVSFGIVAMRFVAYLFTVLIKKYPSLEESAFVVIAVLGLKLVLVGTFSLIPGCADILSSLSGSKPDLIFSGMMIMIFITPLFIIKKRTLLFTTHDGVNMYIGKSSYWYCDERYKKYKTKVCSGQDYKKGIIQFSSENALDEFINWCKV